MYHSTSSLTCSSTVASSERKKKVEKTEINKKKNLCRRHHTTPHSWIMRIYIIIIIYRFGTNRLRASGSHGCPTRVYIYVGIYRWLSGEIYRKKCNRRRDRQGFRAPFVRVPDNHLHRRTPATKQQRLRRRRRRRRLRRRQRMSERNGN